MVIDASANADLTNPDLTRSDNGDFYPNIVAATTLHDRQPHGLGIEALRRVPTAMPAVRQPEYWQCYELDGH